MKATNAVKPKGRPVTRGNLNSTRTSTSVDTQGVQSAIVVGKLPKIVSRSKYSLDIVVDEANNRLVIITNGRDTAFRILGVRIDADIANDRTLKKGDDWSRLYLEMKLDHYDEEVRRKRLLEAVSWVKTSLWQDFETKQPQ